MTSGGETLRRDEKAELIATLAERMRGTSTVFATDFRGLTVKEISDLRQRLRAAEVGYSVVKNTLARRAADEAGRAELVEYLSGPTGLAWVGGDPAVAAKALHEFAAAHDEVFSILGGILDGAVISPEDLTRLAKLPPREELLAKLAGGVAAPLTGLAGGLNGLIGGLARSLGALQAQRAAEAPAEG